MVLDGKIFSKNSFKIDKRRRFRALDFKNGNESLLCALVRMHPSVSSDVPRGNGEFGLSICRKENHPDWQTNGMNWTLDRFGAGLSKSDLWGSWERENHAYVKIRWSKALVLKKNWKIGRGNLSQSRAHFLKNFLDGLRPRPIHLSLSSYLSFTCLPLVYNLLRL